MARSNRNCPFWRTTFALLLFLRISLRVLRPIPKHRPISSRRMVPPESFSRIGRIIDAIASGTGPSKEGPSARRLGFPLVHPFDQSLDRFISRYCILPAPYVPQTTSAKPVDGIQRMQRIDENCQVGLAGVARTDEDGEWAQIDFRSRNRAEVGNRQSDGLATFWLAHVPAVYPTTRAAATVRRLRCGQPWGSPSHASKSAVSCRRLARARRSRNENGEVL